MTLDDEGAFARLASDRVDRRYIRADYDVGIAGEARVIDCRAALRQTGWRHPRS